MGLLSFKLVSRRLFVGTLAVKFLNGRSVIGQYGIVNRFILL